MLSRHGGMEKYGIFVRQKNIKVSNSIMEEKKEMDEGLFKSRSYLSCLNEGLKLPTRHILSLLRFLYPSLIAGAVVMGLWGVFFNHRGFDTLDGSKRTGRAFFSLVYSYHIKCVVPVGR